MLDTPDSNSATVQFRKVLILPESTKNIKVLPCN
uniref:Uncharacterized protein n=1 Tax=Triticum urartu TaxID=4572 RepID=A0A8R7QTH0_TRIUA